MSATLHAHGRSTTGAFAAAELRHGAGCGELISTLDEENLTQTDQIAMVFAVLALLLIGGL